jgi:hypothetical protein
MQLCLAIEWMRLMITSPLWGGNCICEFSFNLGVSRKWRYLDCIDRQVVWCQNIFRFQAAMSSTAGAHPTTLSQALAMTPIKNTEDRYGAIAILFHWSMALLVIGLAALGLYMVTLPDVGFNTK